MHLKTDYGEVSKMTNEDMGQRKAKQVATYVDPAIAEKLQERADREHRTLSNLVASILARYVEDDASQS
jgi:hypothetical protein